LLELNQELENLSYTDALTGIRNRRFFDDELKREWERARRLQLPISLLLIDVDHFKKYNDLYGHSTGDQCLKNVAMVLETVKKRSIDTVARFGGEEFAFILPNTSEAGAIEVANAARSAIRDMLIQHENSPVAEHVTISIGLATLQPEIKGDNSQELIVNSADKALYLAKNLGRNRIEAFKG